MHLRHHLRAFEVSAADFNGGGGGEDVDPGKTSLVEFCSLLLQQSVVFPGDFCLLPDFWGLLEFPEHLGPLHLHAPYSDHRTTLETARLPLCCVQ